HTHHYRLLSFPLFFSFNHPPTTDIYTLSLHDALPISLKMLPGEPQVIENPVWIEKLSDVLADGPGIWNPLVKRGTYVSAGMKLGDRKSTRLNSSHVEISYAVFCLKKKKKDMRDVTLKT